MNIKVLILAAGQGTRMKSEIPKVMHKVCNLPMLEYVVANAESLSDEKPIIVVGHKAEKIKEYIGARGKFVLQEQRLGTGHAIMIAADHIKDDDMVLIICGDTPLITKIALESMKEKMKTKDAIIMTSIVDNPFGYGRIITDTDGNFIKIVEEKDATEEERKVKVINGGTYFVRGSNLLENLKKITNENSQKEYYLTDIFKFINNVGFVQVDESELLGINSRVQLAQANKIMQRKINENLMNEGVEFVDPEHTYVDKGVKIGRDSIIYPNCHLRGKTIIGENCKIMEGSTIENSIVGNFITIRNSVITESEIGDYSTIGPFAYLRPKSIIGKNVKIGDFVEVKNANMGDGSKASHLSYIGDATVGENVNIGCGVVFVNYDGKNKFRSTVNNNAFVGSNVNVVAPVEIGEGAYIATGTTVTKDIPAKALCVGRSRETIKEDWNKNQ